MLETVILAPVILALLVGAVGLARVTYTYYMLEKVMYNLGRSLTTLEGVDYCNPQNDTTLIDATNYALTGTIDATGPSVVPGLTPAMVQVLPERFDPTSQQIFPCTCAYPECDGLAPDYIVVSLTGGYPVNPVFPTTGGKFVPASIQLRPSVRVPYAGP